MSTHTVPDLFCLHLPAPIPRTSHPSSPLFYPALKIHLSSETKAVLEEFDGFELELRGDVEMKVKKKSLAFPTPWSQRVPRLLPSLSLLSNLGKWVCFPTPNSHLFFPPGQRQGSDLLAPGRAWEQHPRLSCLPCCPSTPNFPVPEVTVPGLEKQFKQLRCANPSCLPMEAPDVTSERGVNSEFTGLTKACSHTQWCTSAHASPLHHDQGQAGTWIPESSSSTFLYCDFLLEREITTYGRI